MKVLVTGVSGFIGSHLIALLVREGHQVTALVRQANISSPLRKTGVEIVSGDLRDRAAMIKAIGNAECVYHMAAKTTKDRLSKREYYAHNVEGTKNVALAALKAGVNRLVYASSVGVYGTNRNLSIDEKTPPQPDSYYRETKLAGEREVLRLHRSHGLPAVIARLGSTFGPGSHSLVDMTRKIATGSFRIVGTGENHDQMIYVEDLVSGLQLCGTVKGIEGRTYVLAGAQPAKLKELLGIIAQEMGVQPSFGHLPMTPFRIYRQLGFLFFRLTGFQLPRSDYYNLFLTDHIFKTTAAQNDLSYSPKTSLKEGLRRLIDWYRAQGYLTR